MGNSFRARPAAPRSLALTALLVAPAAAQAPGPDPFLAGLRWSDASTPGAPWIPRDLCLAGEGELVLSGHSVGTPHVALYGASAQGDADPAAVGPTLPGALGVVQVAGGREVDALYSLVQLPHPTAASRRTLVARRDRVQAAGGGPLGADWIHEPAELTAGSALLATDVAGRAPVLGLYEKEQTRVHLDWLDPDTGAVAARTTVDGLGLSALEVAAGGARVAVACGLDLYVAAPDGTVLHHEALATGTQALGLSDDGDTLVVGEFGGLRVLRWNGAAYAPVFADAVSSQMIATRVDVSGGGETVAVGYWNYVAGANVRLRLLDGASGDVLYEVLQSGSGGGLQNYPEVVQVTPDGQRAAFGLWGVGDTRPELYLLQRGQAGNVLNADLPGSVYALALSTDGTRVAVGLKDGHANVFATTGEVRLYDTGERDVQVVGAPQLGGALHLQAQVGAGASGLFLLGTGSAAPLAVPGVDGALLLDATQPLWAFGGHALPGDRTGLTLQVPNNPSILGQAYAAQAVGVGAGGLALTASRAHLVLL